MKARNERARWIAVDSSAVRAVRFHPRQRKLDVQFSHSSVRYEYGRVPPSKFRKLMRVESKGAFVNREIKPRHPYRRLPRGR